MAKPDFIELTPVDRIRILYDDRSILAIDKPPGWMLVPISWQKTGHNLQAALLSSIAAGDFWAHSRNIRYIRYVHRLDAETSGVMLFAKSPGALRTFADLFEDRRMEKIYLAVTRKAPPSQTWSCRLSIGPDPKEIGRMQVDEQGKAAGTDFRWIAQSRGFHLIEARPYTGRTHQIRVHLAAGGTPIVGDEMYGGTEAREMGLRAVGLAYRDPFTRKVVAIRAGQEEFLARYHFAPDTYRFSFQSLPPRPESKSPAGDGSSRPDSKPGGH